MEGKVWAMLAVYSIVVLSVVGVGYYMKVDSQKLAMLEAQSSLNGYTEAVASKEAKAASMKEQFTELKKQYDNFINLTETKQKLTKEVADLESEKAALYKRFVGLVQSTRSNAVGSKLPEVKLLTGAVLKDVSFKTINDTEVTMNHALGVMRVPGTDLPDDLREKFRYAMPPMVAVKLKPSDTSPAPTSSLAAATPVSTSAFAAGSAPAPPSGTADAAKIQIEIDALDTKIESLEKSKQEWIQRASELRTQSSYAQVSGKPTFTINAQTVQAEQNVNSINSQVEKIRTEQVTLKKKMVDAMSGPK